MNKKVVEKKELKPTKNDSVKKDKVSTFKKKKKS